MKESTKYIPLDDLIEMGYTAVVGHTCGDDGCKVLRMELNKCPTVNITDELTRAYNEGYRQGVKDARRGADDRR